MATAILQISETCLGPPTSPIKAFRVPELPDSTFIVYTSGPYLVAVQQIQNGTDDAADSQPLLLHIPKEPTFQAESCCQDIAGNQHVAICTSGQQRCIAASSGSFVVVFSLQRYLEKLVQQTWTADLPQQVLVDFQHSSGVVALSWTNAGDGLLVAGSLGDVTMYQTSGSTSESCEDRVKQIWMGKFSTVTTPQDMISAGAHCWAPAASAQTGSKTATVWWPPNPPEASDVAPEEPSEPAKTSPREPNEMGYNAEIMSIMSKLGPEKDKESTKPVAKAEEANPEGDLNKVRDWTIAEQLRHPYPIVTLDWSPCNLQRGAYHTTEEEDSSLRLPESNPALLTVSDDGTLRVWVEVTLTVSASRNPFDTSGTPAALPGLPGGSHFCVTLLIQPPANLWTGGLLRAAWAVPEGQLVAHTGPQIRASKVLWITAVANSKDANGSEREHLLVWAVDGLAGVLLGNSSGEMSRPARNPRALLWGQHTGQLSWAGDVHCRPQHLTTVSLDTDAPILHIFESHHSREFGLGEFRMYRLDPIENEPMTPSGPGTPGIVFANAPRQLALHDYSAYNLLGHVGKTIQSLGVHENGQYAVTLDEAGCVLLWSTDPLTPEMLLPQAKGPWRAVCWCCQLASDPSQSAVALIAAANSTSLVVYGLYKRQDSLDCKILATIPLPGSGPVLKQLCSSATPGEMHILGMQSAVSGGGVSVWSVHAAREYLALKEVASARVSAELTALAVYTSSKAISFLCGARDGSLRLGLLSPDQDLSMREVASLPGEVKAISIAGNKCAAVSDFGDREQSQGYLSAFDLGTDHQGACEVTTIALSEEASGVCWLDRSYLVPSLAVSYRSKGVAIFSSNRAGQWESIALLSSTGLSSCIITTTKPKPLIVASGNSLYSVSRTLKAPIKGRRRRKRPATTLARLLIQHAGARPFWHSQVLKLLLSSGRLSAAVLAIRAMLAAEHADQKGTPPHATEFWDKNLLDWVRSLASQMPDDSSISDSKPNESTKAKDSNDAADDRALASVSGTAAHDPFAFDMSAFGAGPKSGAESEHRESEQAEGTEIASSRDPFAFDMSAFDKQDPRPDPVVEQRQVKTPADPYAFDMAAFGNNTEPGQTAQSSGTADPYAFNMSAFDETAPKQSTTQSADPYAFSMSAFGDRQPSNEAAPNPTQSSSADPYAFDMSAFGASIYAPDPPPSAKQEQKPATSSKDPFAFDPSAFGGGTQAGVTPDRPETSKLRQPEKTSVADGTSIKNKRPPLIGKLPPKESFTPLSGSELRKVKALLLAPQQDESSESESDSRASSPRSVSNQVSDIAEPLGNVESIAEALTEGGPERISSAVALDSAGLHAAADIQLAVIERGERVTSQASTSGRPFEPPPVDADTAASWSEMRLRTMTGLSSRALCWGALSQSPEALVTLIAAMVPQEVEQDIRNEPRWEYSSSGQKTLDLGFGGSGPGAAQNTVTWTKLRAVGAGLWMVDRQMVRQYAESLAKARYAETKDPSTCALFYIALGKKTLLQGLYRTASQRKQADFLARDFSQDKHKEAACKNAFVLLGQHRYEMAAAFFLLGGAFKDAVGVCAHEQGDPQLALFLCKLIDPLQGSQLEQFLLLELLEEALAAADVDSAAALYLRNGDPGKAIRVLLAPDSTNTRSRKRRMDQCDTLGLLRAIVSFQPGAKQDLLQERSGLIKLSRQCGMTWTSSGAAGLGLESLLIGRCLSPTQSNALELTHLAVLTELGGGANYEAACKASPDFYTDLLKAYKELGCDIDDGIFRDMLSLSVSQMLPEKEYQRSPGRQVHPPESLLRTSLQARASTISRPQHPHINNNILSEGYELLNTDGEKLFDVCVCNSDPGDWGNPVAEWRPLMVASGRHGLIEGEVHPRKGLPDDLISSATSESSQRGTTFTAMLSEMLDAVRWSSDPWGSAASGASLSAAASRNAVALSNSPSHRCNGVATATLASHPYRPLYLSGSASGEICLWQFGKKGAIAGYSPLLPNKSSLVTAGSSSLFSSTPQSWSANGVNISQWGQPQAVTFSECGERFAAIGEGGVVACWRIDAPKLVTTDTGALGRADWCRQGLSKRGVDVTYVGASSSVLAVGGFSEGGKNLAVWDTLSAPAAGPIASLAHHPGMVTSLQAVPGRRMLISADESGLVAAVDLRMLGGDKSRRAVLWQSRNPTGGVTCMASASHPTSDMQLTISGSRNGTIGVWAAAHGQLLQSLPALPAASAQKNRGRHSFLDSLRSKSTAVSPVTGVAICPEGIVASSLSGMVSLLPFVQ